MPAAITVEGLSKRYRLGQNVGQYGRVTEAAVAAVGRQLRRIRSAPEKAAVEKEIWALKDVSLVVPEGQVLGVIGRNGAGKTTLLKILSRITEPTEGWAELHGRVGSLLEVGTGFHPDLTGRENVSLNGAILGMRRSEVESKFDEIVEFAGVAKFIDTPVKRYSTGMYLRLAFSVAAHLEPEILIVDEVLAVGDAAFQRKCLAKMQDVGRAGRTVLFVSHNMAAVMSLCDRAVLMQNGHLVSDGSAGAIVQEYLATVGEEGSGSLIDRADRRGDGSLRVTTVALEEPDGAPTEFIQSGANARFALDYTTASGLPVSNVSVTVALDSLFGERIAVLQTGYVDSDFQELPPSGRIVCQIPRVPLVAGVYSTSIYITVNGVVADWVIGASTFRVEPGDFYGTGRYPDVQDGKILLDQSWTKA